MHNKRYTKEEEAYLEDNWGLKSMTIMMKDLNRTRKGIESKARRMELGNTCEVGYFLTIKDVAELFGCSKCLVTSWINDGLTVSKRVLSGRRLRTFIKMENLIEWLKVNLDRWSSVNLELNALGTEEEWLKEKRRKDFEKIPKKQRHKYTKEEEDYIWILYSNKFDLEEIANKTGRSKVAIASKLIKLRKQRKNKEHSENVA